MQLDVEVGRRQAQLITNLFAGEVQPLAHQKKSALRCWQFIGASFQHLEKLATTELLFRVAPFGGGVRKMPVCLETKVFQRIGVVVFGGFKPADLPAVMPQGINHLVFEDADQSGLELRPVVKSLRFGQGRQHGLGHGIFGPGVVAQLKPGEAQQIGAMPNQLLLEGGCCVDGHGVLISVCAALPGPALYPRSNNEEIGR